jgi:citrate lyase beta subunit
MQLNTLQAADGCGAFALDDAMIDAPTVKQAQGVLSLARACGVE